MGGPYMYICPNTSDIHIYVHNSEIHICTHKWHTHMYTRVSWCHELARCVARICTYIWTPVTYIYVHNSEIHICTHKWHTCMYTQVTHMYVHTSVMMSRTGNSNVTSPQFVIGYTWGWHTEWRRSVECLIFISHFPQKSPMISGSFAERDV